VFRSCGLIRWRQHDIYLDTLYIWTKYDRSFFEPCACLGLFQLLEDKLGMWCLGNRVFLCSTWHDRFLRWYPTSRSSARRLQTEQFVSPCGWSALTNPDTIKKGPCLALGWMIWMGFGNVRHISFGVFN
jgi:hypothetical protein